MFMPELDGPLTVELPAERARVIVRAVVDKNTVIVELTGAPMSKDHQWKKGDFITCRRADSPFGEVWVGVSKDDEERQRKMEEIRAANARAKAVAAEIENAKPRRAAK